MRQILRFGILFLFTLILNFGFGQGRDSVLIQFSGQVFTEENDQLIPLPYTNIYVAESGRGTYTNFEGFFSIVVRKGDVIEFSSVGFKTIAYTIPDTLTTNRYSVFQIMPKDTLTLPETVVYPWPSKEHFEIEFLALEIPTDLQDRAAENLASANLERLREYLPYDGIETGSMYLRRQAQSYYSFGQAKPMNILNPIAWSKFFKAWKNGDFKRKK